MCFMLGLAVWDIQTKDLAVPWGMAIFFIGQNRSLLRRVYNQIKQGSSWNNTNFCIAEFYHASLPHSLKGG